MGVEFEDNSLRQNNFDEPTPKMATWLISHGLAKDVAGATRLEIGLIVVFFAIAIYFFFFF